MSFTRPGPFSYKFPITFVTSFLCLLLSACASDSYTAKGATKGAVQGAAAGAVGGLISALVFGGDPVDRAARGAVYGGAIGAVSGGVAGHQVDKQVKAQTQAQADAQARSEAQARAQTQTGVNGETDLELLRKEIGEHAFAGLASLAECRHDITMDSAKKAQKSSNPNYRLAGLWLELLNYADLGKKKRIRKMLPVIVKADWDINTEAEARQATYEGVAELAEIRKEFNLPVSCRS